MKKLLITLCAALLSLAVYGQGKVRKVYDESIDPVSQIAEAVKKGADEGKYVVCQVGGNWCKWCLWFAAFIEDDAEIKKIVDDNFVYIHVNYDPRQSTDESTKTMLASLGNPTRFGFPALVVLDGKGNVIHIQDSSFLEAGQGYDKEKVMRFFRNWTPEAVAPKAPKGQSGANSQS